MRITDLLNKESILLSGAPKSKSEAIDMLVELQAKGGNIADKDEYKKGILAREEKGSNAVGEGIMKANGKEIKARAVMQIMAAGIKKGTEVELVVTGGDEQAVLDEFVKMFEDGFGE